MKIIEMTAENIKKIKAIKITPKNNMVVIEGKNAAGKTSALDCIAYALGGKKLIPDSPIRDGEEKAFVEMTIGDYKISRTWTKKGTYLKLENKDGFKSSNPQNMLDAVIGDLSFDPMKFCNYSKTERIDILKKICGLNFSDLEKKHKENYDERTYLNRQLKDIEAQIKPYENTINLTMEADLKTNMRSIEEVEEERKTIEKSNKYIDDTKAKQKNILAKIKEKQIQLTQLETEIYNLRQEEKELNNTDIPEYRNTSNLAEEIHKIIEYQKKQEQYKLYDNLLQKKNNIKDKINEAEKEIHVAKEEKGNRIKNAKMPIAGLGFSTGDVSYNGVEFSEISSAQKIKISMAIAMALNPKIKIIRILNGSLLDSDTMKEIETIAKEKDFQIWVERVSDKKSDNCIYIEEGEIK